MKNKKLKWLIPVCAAAVLAVIALVLVFALGGGEKTAAQKAEFEIYWNVDGVEYRSGKMTRSENGEGLVNVTFSQNGKQTRIPVAGRTLAQKIDSLEYMGLEIDENGVVTDCYEVDDMDGKTIAYRYFVTAVDGNKITCNSAPTLKGYDVVFELTEETGVWDVGMSGITCGIPGTVKMDDQVIVVLDRQGKVHTVYVVSVQAPPPIYWNVNRMYDSKTKTTTREMDITGGYTIELVCEGKPVTVKTRDYEMVQAMDAMAAKCFALGFDENNMVNQVINAGTACGGGSCASWYRVDSYSDNYLEATKPSTGTTYSGLVSKNVQAYDVTGYGDYIGQPTEIREGDKVHCLRDSLGRIVVVFVVGRTVESEMYWNVERMWDSKTSLTTRKPAKDGWYYVTVAVRGKQMVVKTQNKEHVQTIDARAAKCFGMKLNGDVIEKVYQPDAVTGGGTFASWYDITELDGRKLTCKKNSTGDVRSGKMSADCEIYNVSTNAAVVGEITTLQVGDRIHAVKNKDGEACVIYVVTRFLNLPTYYNLTRMYNTTTKQTTRVPDADGYYVFEMAHEGKLVTVKTKSKAIANDIDSQSARCLGLSVKDGIVYKAIHSKETVAYRGGPTSSYYHVTKVTSGGFSTIKRSTGETKVETLAAGCKIYNVTNTAHNNLGEPTKIRVGDKVHCLRDGNGNVALVYVIGRYEDWGVYYNLERKWDSNAQTTTRVPDADGYYVFRMAHDGQEVTVKTTSLEVANNIDMQSAKVLGLNFDENGLAIQAMHAQYTKECEGGIGPSYATITAMDGNKITVLKDGKYTTHTVASNANIFDVSGAHKNNAGERTTLRMGDHIHALEEKNGALYYIYTVSRGLELVEVEHECQHVTENVQWYQWDGKSGFGESGYYVLTEDSTLASTVSIAAGKEITLCLNGHTITSDTRFFKIYGTLNICDHKDEEGNYHGKLTSSYSDVVDADGKVTTKVYASLAYLYNATSSSQLNIYGGNFEHTGKLSSGGLVYVGNSAEDENNVPSFNLYDGVLTGGQATSGGAVYVSNIGTFGMHGGMITDCHAAKGGAVLVQSSRGEVLITDGIIQNCTASETGAGIQMNNGSVVMTGGLITKNTATGNGGGISIDAGTLQMSGGVLGGNTGKEGGNLRVALEGFAVLSGDAQIINGNAKTGGNITMYGQVRVTGNTQITGGKANLGDAINIFSNYDEAQTNLTVLGGKIEGNIRYDSNKGQSVAVYLLGGDVDTINVYDIEEGTVETQIFVGSHAKVKNISLGIGKYIQIFEDILDETASIGVSVKDNSVPFATITNADHAACFTPAEPNLYVVENRDNQLYLVSALAEHKHCACNGSAVGLGEHTCEETTWSPWAKTDSLPTSGCYYLTEDVTLTKMVTLEKSADLQICLNGHTITGPGPLSDDDNKRVFLLKDADLTIADCQGTGVITNEPASGTSGGLIYTYNNGYSNTLNLFGGTLTTTSTCTSGGVVYLGNKNNPEYFTTMNMYGGQIIDGAVSGRGGNLMISNGSVCNLYAGQITGGSGVKAGNVYLTTGTLNLSGDVKIMDAKAGNNLYMLKDNVLNVGDLAETAEIHFCMEKPGKFATLADPADAQCFHSDDKAYKVSAEGNTLSLVANDLPQDTHIHCVCGGHLTDDNKGSHTECDGSVEWTAWNGTTSLETDGHYYLVDADGDGKIAVTETVTIPANANISICLNGVTLEGSTARIFLVAGGSETTVFNICDCHEEENWGGLSSTNSGVAPLIHSYTNNRGCVQINIFGGNLQSVESEPTYGDFAGLIRLGNTSSANELYKAELNLYDGNLMNGSGKGGGNLYISAGCSFHMYGGSVTGGYASGLGGNIWAASSAKVHIEGDVNISGATNGGNLYLADGLQLTVGDLADTAFVGISMSKPGKFVTLTDPNDAGCFHSDDSAYAVENQEGVLSLQAAESAHTHCLCNGQAVGLGQHTCEEDAEWTPWSTKTALPTTSGSYYLTEDVTLDAMLDMKGKLDLRICLNGHTITGPGGGKRPFLLRDADLSITDCTGKGVVTNEATDSLSGGVIYCYTGSSCNDYNNSVNLYGGTLTITGTAKSGGVVYLGNNYNEPYHATLNVYGGAITGGSTKNNGGNVYVQNHSVVNLYGGEISNGNAGASGGNILLHNGTVNLLGGSLVGGSAGTSGADLEVRENGSVTVGGNVQVGGVYLTTGKTLAVSADVSLEGASIGVKLAEAAVVATNVTSQAVADCFSSVDGWNSLYDEEAKTLSFQQ